MSISFAPELGEAEREAAEQAGVTVPGWLAQAAETKLRHDADAKIPEEAADKRRSEGLRAYLAEWQAEHGGSEGDCLR